MIDRASGYVDPDEDFQLDEEDQDNDEEESETEDDPEPIQVCQSQAEGPTETPVGAAVMSQWLQGQEAKTATDEPFAARTRQTLGSDPEMSAFADVKEEKT